MLDARGAELERAFGYGVVRQLFDGVLRAPGFDPAALFTGAARFAGPLLEVGIEVPPTEDPFALRHALYWLTANVAAQQPLALIVDDAHWADSASLAVVSHIAHRLSGIPVAIVVASRVEASVDDLRGQAEADGALLHLAPLGEQASAVARAIGRAGGRRRGVPRVLRRHRR